MASLREYCEELSTSQLRALVREECEGRGELPIETIMTICEILAARNPNLPSVKQSILNMCRIYLEE